VYVPKKLILLELNEVPYRVIDEYCRQRPDGTLAGILSMSKQYETVTEDRLALDPWISWPTLHRGVNDEKHNILHLGQMLDETDIRYPPIWQLLKQRGLRVGVFGSLHSSSLPKDVRDYSFYLPDYFADEAFAHPIALAAFQDLNLSMTRESARNVTRKIPFGSAVKFIAQSPMLGLKFSTLVDSMVHLAREAFDNSLRVRRRSYQPLVTMDLFLRQLKRKKPDFATFYTNHVAAAMHRYWGAAFPEDYDDAQLDKEWIAKYNAEILFAMEKLDLMMKRLRRFVEQNPEYCLMVASSMGQAAIPATMTHEFLTIVDIPRFMKALGVPQHGWELKPSMVPCCCVVVMDQYRDLFASKIESLSVGGFLIKRDARPISPLSYDERERGFFQFFVQFDSFSGIDTAVVADEVIKLSDLGLGFIAHEDGVNCTAQHVPTGSLWVYHKGMQSQGLSCRDSISTLDVAPSILRFFGHDKPVYMPGTTSVTFDS
jgi:hypothetical protein